MKSLIKVTCLSIASLYLCAASNVYAYTCTFKNNTHANLIIKFYRDSGKSDEMVVPPLRTVTWNAGKVPVIGAPWSIKGMKIFEMAYAGKEILEAKNKEDYWSASRPYNPTWELFEEFPVEAGQVADKIKFTLKRNPGGVGGSTYPGGTIWTSSVLDVANPNAKAIEAIKTMRKNIIPKGQQQQGAPMATK